MPHNTGSEEHKKLYSKVNETVRWNSWTLSNDEAVKEIMTYVESNYTPNSVIEQAKNEAIYEHMKKNRRWFEKMAEYADVKADAMAEYDDMMETFESKDSKDKS